MATALERDRIPTDEECFAFTPPPVYVGMPVAFYRQGEKRAEIEVGIVAKVVSTHKHITIVLAHGREVYPGVRHISDPKFIKTPVVRERGAWDYTEHDSMQAERWAAMEKRLAELEAKAGGGDEDRLAGMESKLHSHAIKIGKLASEIGSTAVKE